MNCRNSNINHTTRREPILRSTTLQNSVSLTPDLVIPPTVVFRQDLLVPGIYVLPYYYTTYQAYYVFVSLVYYITVSLYHFLLILLCHRITALKYYCITVLLHYSRLLQYYCITVLLHRSITAVLHALQYNCITVLLQYCITV